MRSLPGNGRPDPTRSARCESDGGEVTPTGGRAETRDVFDHEHLRLKVLHVIEEMTEEAATRVLLQALVAVIRAICRG